jgi:hypothetical protein
VRADRDLIPEGLRAESMSIRRGGVDISVAPVAPSAACPTCGCSSRRIHSRYFRKIADLPWHGTPVVFRVRVRRYFCDEASCQRRIFCERLPEVAAHARKTDRLEGRSCSWPSSSGAGRALAWPPSSGCSSPGTPCSEDCATHRRPASVR